MRLGPVWWKRRSLATWSARSPSSRLARRAPRRRLRFSGVGGRSVASGSLVRPISHQNELAIHAPVIRQFWLYGSILGPNEERAGYSVPLSSSLSSIIPHLQENPAA